MQHDMIVQVFVYLQEPESTVTLFFVSAKTEW